MLILLLAAAAAEGTPLTLRDALDRALAANLELAGARRANAVVRWRLVEARSAFDPTLDLGVRAGGARTPTNDLIDGRAYVTTGQGSFSAGLSQALPTGGSLSASWSEFRTTSDSANAASAQFVSDSVDLSLSQPLLRGAGPVALASLQDAHLDLEDQALVWREQVERLALDVSDAYWGLVSAREGLTLAQRSVELAQDQLDRTAERLDAGFAGSGDVLQVQVSAGQARQQLVVASASLEAAQDRLARLLGLPLAAGGTLTPTDRPALTEALPDREALLAQARQRNAGLLRAEIARERARRWKRRARNEALPYVGLNASAGLSSGAIRAAEARAQLFGVLAPTWSVGVGFQLPVLLRAARARLGVASLEDEAASLRLQAAYEDTQLAVDAAVRAVHRDLASLEVAVQTLAFAERSLDAQRELLTEGRGATRDVVDALESLRRAEVDKLSAQIALQRSLLEAGRVEGSLLDALGLGGALLDPDRANP